MSNNSFPYLSPFEDYVKTEFTKRSENNGNFLRQTRSPWVRVVSNAIVNLKDLGGPDSVEGLILSPNRLSFAKAYGYEGDGTIVGFSAKTGEAIKSADSDRHRPPPVVDSIEIDYAGSYGALRKATINLRVFSIDQFEIVERFFLSPANTVLLEWGWNDYGQTLLETKTLGKITDIFDNPDKILPDLRKNSKGRYDAMVGVITNFQYSIVEDGSFVCNIEVGSKGEMYLMMKNTGIQPRNPDEVSDGITPAVDPDEDAINKLLRRTKNIGVATNKKKDLLQNIFIPHIGTSDSSGELTNVTISVQQSVETSSPQSADDAPIVGPVTRQSDNVFYVNWGWIEDSILSDLHLSDKKVFNGFQNIEGKGVDMFTINSSNSVISSHPNIISSNWDVLLIPNPSAPDFDNNGRPVKTASGKPSDFSRVNLTMNQHSFHIEGDEWNGDIRSLYINSDKLIELLNEHESSIYDFLMAMLKDMNDASSGLWDLDLSDSFEVDGKEIISIIDKNYTPSNATVTDFLHDEKKLYKFKALQTNSIINSMNFQSNLPKEMGTIVMLSNDSENINNEYTIADSKPAQAAIWKNTDRIFNKITSQDMDTNTEAETEPETPATSTDFFKENFYKIQQDPTAGNKKQTIVFACKHKETIRSLLYTNSTDKRNNYNNNILVPIELNLTVDGISGIHIGNVFTIDGVSKKLQTLGLWQIVGLKHSISDANWQTEIRGQMRVKSKDVK